MAGIPEEGFTDAKQVEAWLKARPKNMIAAFSKVGALRAALRALPFAGRAWSAGYRDRTIAPRLTEAVFQANAISRVAATYPTREIERAAASAASAARASAARAAAADADAAYAAARADAAARAAAASAARAADAAADAAASAARAADAAASAARAAAAAARAAAVIWAAVTADARALESGVLPTELADRPLWPGEAPDWWEHERLNLDKALATAPSSDPEKYPETRWPIWSEWYRSRVFGTPSFGLPREMADELDRRIALGGGRKDFWDRPAEAINGEIAGWVEEARRRARPVFISYNSADLDAAKQIGGVIDEGGYSVFAQYKDMPPGSNFIAEMQRGLENMGKFSPIYSPDYIASDICQDEWNAAYNMDRGGRRRLIVGFLVRPTVLKPLQKQICYVPLYAVPEDKARQAILDALAADGTKHSPERSRGEAREAASPDPVIHDGRIDVNAESPIEQPFIDDELAHLPEEMRKLLRLIIASMSTANAPIMAREAATDYRDELITNGARPHMPDLIRCAEFIQADIEIAVQFDASWYAGGLKKALEEFSRLHEKLRQRFPLVMLRDHAIENSSIDSASFDKPEFSSSHKQLANASGKAEDDGKASEEFRRVMERRERQRQDIESLREPAKPVDGELIPADKDRVSPANLKKRFLFDVSGTADRLLERVAKVTDIADSEAGKAIIKASKEMLKAIWGG